MQSRPLMVLRLTTAAVQELGSTPHGALSIFPITGGSFEGERLRGTVLPGGGDWVSATDDGTFELTAKAKSSLWTDRRFQWRFFPDHIEFQQFANGSGKLGRCYFLSNGISGRVGQRHDRRSCVDHWHLR